MVLQVNPKVEVWSGDGGKMIGYGHVVDHVDVYVFSLPNRDLLTMENCETVPPVEAIERWLEQGAVLRVIQGNPKIKMEDGSFTYGCKCWWREVKDEQDKPGKNTHS